MTFGGESPGEIGACPSTVSWLPISSENWFLFLVGIGSVCDTEHEENHDPSGFLLLRRPPPQNP